MFPEREFRLIDDELGPSVYICYIWRMDLNCGLFIFSAGDTYVCVLKLTRRTFLSLARLQLNGKASPAAYKDYVMLYKEGALTMLQESQITIGMLLCDMSHNV